MFRSLYEKVIIVDDESAGRKLIREYLNEYPDLIIVGEANNGVDALSIINKFKPDIVFLDVEMPGLNGFDVISKLEEIPQIIFSTAYDQYAIKAFEVHAVDYLLKPYTKERFKKSIQKAKNEEYQMSNLAADIIMEKTVYPERILVESGRKLITIAVSKIIRIEADGDYSKLVLDNANHLSNYGISKLESKLNPAKFVRVHRSSIINIEYIQSMDRYVSTFDIFMKNGDTVRVSRGYKDKIKHLIY